MTATALRVSAETLTDLPSGVRAQALWTSAQDVMPVERFGVALREEAPDLIVVLIPGSERVARTLSDLVRGFIGPSHARNLPPKSLLPSGEPFSDAVLDLAGAHAPLVMLVPPTHRDGFLRALERLLIVNDRRPATSVSASRPLASVLRDFEAAVARKDVGIAGVLRDEAWATGRLSLVNRSLLDTRVLAAAGDLTGLLAQASRLRLSDLRLPGPVENDLIAALGEVHLNPVVGDGREAISRTFRTAIAPVYGAAFRDHRIAASATARLAWVAHYLSLAPVPLPALREVIQQAPVDERPQLLALLEDEDTRGEDYTEEDELRALQAAGEHAAAFAAAEAAAADATVDAQVTDRVLLTSADALDDPVRRAHAVARPAAAEGKATATPPFADVDDWGAWLEALFDDPDGRDALKVLDHGYTRWTEDLRSGEVDVDGWSDHIQAVAGEEVFRRALPLLVQAVVTAVEAEQPGKSRGRSALTALAYAVEQDPAPGSAGLDALGDLCEALLPFGLDADAYSRLVEQSEAVFRRLSSPPRQARWVVDLVAMLLQEPAPSEEARGSAIRRMVALLLPDARRSRPLVKPEVWTEISELVEDAAGLEDALPALKAAAATEAVDGPLEDLVGKTVLLHTLVEAAALRAKSYLEAAVDVRVWTDSSHVGGKDLRDLAERADIVVVASKASKHSAYETIRPAARERLVYASGKGWSSLVTAVTEASIKLAPSV